MKILKLLKFGFVGLLLTGCATTSPVDSSARTLCVKTFGTDTYLKVLWLPIGSVDKFMMVFLGNNSWQYEIASAMESAKEKRVDLVVWTEPNGSAAFAIEKSLRIVSLYNNSLDHLNFLFVGDASDADRLRPKIEATGAKFYFHQR